MSTCTFDSIWSMNFSISDRPKSILITFKMFLRVYLSFLAFTFTVASDINVDLPLGVALNRKALYDIGKKDFTCLDGSATIPFSHVNDDYCDCKDGSDEPGTAACPTGVFTCRNLGHRPIEIPSSRVNDQICDCCDGSDEWAGYVRCPNICDEIGKKAREAEEKRIAMVKEGHQKRQELAREGKKMKEEKVKKIDEFRAQQKELEPKKIELDMAKQDVEKREREAKDAHDAKWRGELEAKRKASDRFKAEQAFEDLDKNKDQKVSFDEITARTEFDKNLDGVVSPEEASEHLQGSTEVDFDKFMADVWTQISHLYRPPAPPADIQADGDSSTTEAPPPESTPKPFEEPIPGEEEDEVREDEVQDFDIDKYSKDNKKPGSPSSTEETEKMPEYDEATKKLIEEADEARRLFNEVDSKVRDAEEEIRKLEEYSKLDFGPEDEYAPLHNQCFEYTERQYTYKLCLFDRTSQKDKGGSSDTNLGRFDAWSGPPENKYSRQSYKHGLSCWNGPERSTEVRLSCGSENKLTGASEPGKCEYQFEFTTPAACTEPPSHQHSEL